MKGFALIGEFRRQQAVGLHRFALVVLHFVYGGEAVAAAQIAMEINVGGEDVGDLHGDRIGDAGGIGCSKQR